MIGINLALPLLDAAAGDSALDLLTAVSVALVERCDACLRLPGASVGADLEVAAFGVAGKPVLTNLDDALAWARQ